MIAEFVYTLYAKNKSGKWEVIGEALTEPTLKSIVELCGDATTKVIRRKIAPATLAALMLDKAERKVCYCYNCQNEIEYGRPVTLADEYAYLPTGVRVVWSTNAFCSRRCAEEYCCSRIREVNTSDEFYENKINWRELRNEYKDN